jgi:hypothetical protein
MSIDAQYPRFSMVVEKHALTSWLAERQQRRLTVRIQRIVSGQAGSFRTISAPPEKSEIF